MDIIVTTPKSLSELAVDEAETIKQNGGGEYFRNLSRKPTKTEAGDRIFYVDQGYVRGFAVIDRIEYSNGQRCFTSGHTWPPGWNVWSDATTWCWITPIPMKGFQGWRYFNEDVTVICDWQDPMPPTEMSQSSQK